MRTRPDEYGNHEEAKSVAATLQNNILPYLPSRTAEFMVFFCAHSLGDSNGFCSCTASAFGEVISHCRTQAADTLSACKGRGEKVSLSLSFGTRINSTQSELNAK